MPGRPVTREGLQKTVPERRAADSGRQEERGAIRRTVNARQQVQQKTSHTIGMILDPIK